MPSIARSPLGEGAIRPTLTQSVGGSMPSMPSVWGLVSTQSTSEFSQPSSVHMPLGVFSQASSNDIPLAVSDLASSIDMPLAVSSQGNCRERSSRHLEFQLSREQVLVNPP